MKAMPATRDIDAPAHVLSGADFDGQARQWLRRLRAVMPLESAEFICCFESVEGKTPSAWLAVGRLAEITCDVRDGVVVGQLIAGSQVLSKQLLAIDAEELPYVKIFSALASLLRAERGLRSTILPDAGSIDARSLRWFGGWKYSPSATAVSKAASFTLPRFAIRIDADGMQTFNWGGLPLEVIRRALDRSSTSDLASGPRRWSVVDDRLVPDREDYLAAADKILESLSQGKCEKVVLSRKRVLEFSSPLDPVEVFSRLIRQKGHAFQYLMTLGDGETWVGISPELLLRRSGRDIETRPLAGSRRRGASQLDDAEELHSLLTSEKDQREHDIAASLMFNRLQSVCETDTLKIVGQRNVTKLAYIQHLATEMTGQLDPEYDAVDALTCIYPPATILGKPEECAEQILRTCEPFQRSFFTGGLGVLSSNGDCEIALCIRSACVSGHELHLYAGSGYVQGSVPHDEWRETEAKMQPFVDVAGGLST